MHYPSDVLAGAFLGVALGLIVPLSLSAMKVGIVGLPNAGKSTLFNALTKGGAQTGDYPFTTIEPNVAIAQVPDERLEKVAATVKSSSWCRRKSTSTTSPAWSKAPPKGRGSATSSSPRSARPTRSPRRPLPPESDVPHPDGRVDPLADIETIETELVLADYDQVERAARPGIAQRQVLRPQSRHRQGDRLVGFRCCTNWSNRLRRRRGSRYPTRQSTRSYDGTLALSPTRVVPPNWPPPSFSPQTGLFYVNANQSLQRLLHLRSGRKSAGLGRHGSRRLLGSLCCRRSTTRPAKSSGAIRGRAAHARDF